MENKIAAGDGRIARLLNEKRPIDGIVEELYLAAYARPPSQAERYKVLAFIEAGGDDPRPALEDVLWTLMNSKEFMFNH
jgi:hypothetical protein